ncbi:MAG: hypothetical protein ABEH56_02485, partial [Salinirussus sp.]
DRSGGGGKRMSPPDDGAGSERTPYQRATDDTLRTLSRRQQTLTDRVDELDARVRRLETLVTALVHEIADAHDRSVEDVLAEVADERDLPDTGAAPDHDPPTPDDSDGEDDHTRYL